MEALHDIKDAARLLAVSPWTIRSYIRKGKLRPVRIGRLVRLEETELSRFVAGARDGGGISEPDTDLDHSVSPTVNLRIQTEVQECKEYHK